MLLGAIVRDITDPFFAGAIDALSLEARQRGYSVVLGHARERADEALALAADPRGAPVRRDRRSSATCGTSRA